MAKNMFIGGTTGKAQKVKGVYVGAPQAVPNYEDTGDRAMLNNIVEYDAFFDTPESGFTVSEMARPLQWTAEYSYRDCRTIMTAKHDIPYLAFEYAVRSSGGHSTLTIKANDVYVLNASTLSGAFSWSGSLKKGQELEFCFTSGKNGGKFEDYAVIWNFEVSAKMSSIAKKVKKVYIGVDGKAQLCYVNSI